MLNHEGDSSNKMTYTFLWGSESKSSNYIENNLKILKHTKR